MDEREAVDCHQHLWPAALLEELRGRRRPPYLDGWTLHLAGEPPYDVDPAHHDLELRAKQDRADGVGLTLLSLSSPLGIEHLPGDEAAPLLHAWHTGELARHHRRWAAPLLTEADPVGIADTLARPDVVGLQVPATAMGDPWALERLAGVLAVAEAAGEPVLVHPGPAAPVAAERRGPSWWPALTSYPSQQAAAWFAWHACGRSLLPDLRIAFVGLAGLAPLHHERLAARGGELGAVDAGVHYETSSYGARAVDAMARVVGVDPLVLGSDAPYATALDATTDPGLGAAFARALSVSNPHHLMNGGSR